jgi:hypothetical protein
MTIINSMKYSRRKNKTAFSSSKRRTLPFRLITQSVIVKQLNEQTIHSNYIDIM